MKIFYAILIIIIVGLVVVSLKGNDAAAPERVDVVEEQTVTEDESMGDETSTQEDAMTGNEDVMDEEGATDAGMEFPTADDEVIGDESDESDSATSKVFDLDGFNFGYNVETIRVKEGDTVTVNLTSSDGFHDWMVDAFDAATERIREGDTTSVTFVADKVGSYEYYCSVGSHRAQGMVGTLIVE